MSAGDPTPSPSDPPTPKTVVTNTGVPKQKGRFEILSLDASSSIAPLPDDMCVFPDCPDTAIGNGIDFCRRHHIGISFGSAVSSPRNEVPPSAPLPPHQEPVQEHQSDRSPNKLSATNKRARNRSAIPDEIKFSDIKFGPMIGKGAFGEVFKGVLYGQEIAIKKLKVRIYSMNVVCVFVDHFADEAIR
jgi:hypothetical protein